MIKDKQLTLLEFLDTVVAPLNSKESWYETEELWDEYAAKINLPKDTFSDWT